MSDKKDIIYKCGKEIFEKKGFKDTNVAEIMKQAGMATGTFYNYYASKDKLFMEIYNDENVKLKSSIMASLDIEANPILVVREMMMKNLQGMMENPILREWYNRDVFQKLEQSFREENGAGQVDFLYNSFVEVIRKWQIHGKMRSDIDAEMIMAIFGALVNVETHKAEIGLKYFPEVIEYLAEFTMKGLMNN
ncbi:DNA-binding transcriptional regulator EnvR [Oxobacter pfennigii]|uniref:DNA-binding transcriptional regulator EnvR n=1 Tax=Oxobacter pfennigii TaxID=36849 RepID=A0A0P8W6Y3_9CLOT|nr:TetR/AcrR family transcriptional regulator [Oxobacter pfennigii]KPU43547.1 DNA-binding transcriptional regulator EnvR [Oxobacter pfennigii]